jgi:NADPH-dependent ferric siderophore reductase
MAELHLQVVAIEDLTPSMRRLTMTSAGLAGFSYEPGQDLMLAVPSGGGTVRRRYTIRRLDAEARTVDIDFLLHGHGPGARWASGVHPGDTISGVGPRGRVTVDPEAAWHLFVGDDAALPATLAMLEAVAPERPAVVVLEVEDAGHEQPSARPVTWLHRLGDAAGDPARLASHLGSLPLPIGRGAVYLNGERRWVRAGREVLVGRGLDPTSIRLKAYWVLDEANGDHGEPVPEGGFGPRRS